MNHIKQIQLWTCSRTIKLQGVSLNHVQTLANYKIKFHEQEIHLCNFVKTYQFKQIQLWTCSRTIKLLGVSLNHVQTLANFKKTLV